jgi:hypothetical protein
MQIDLHTSGVEADLLPVGDQMAAPTSFEQRLQFPQRPAQLRPRIVGRVPEQLREAFAAMRATGGHQIAQQGARLLRPGERLGTAVPPQHRFT